MEELRGCCFRSIIDLPDGKLGKTWGLVENTGVIKLFSCLFFFPSVEYLPPLDARSSEYSKIRYAFYLFQSYFSLTWSKRFLWKSFLESRDKREVISLWQFHVKPATSSNSELGFWKHILTKVRKCSWQRLLAWSCKLGLAVMSLSSSADKKANFMIVHLIVCILVD